MKQQIQISVKQVYKSLVPRPTKEQYDSLKHSIKENGLLFPIVVDEGGVILDGHTRFDICKELGVEPRFEVKQFDNEYDERHFVIIVNLARRQLNLFQKGEILYPWWKEQKDRSRRLGGKKTWRVRKGIEEKHPRHSEGRLNKRLASILGCGHHTAFTIMYLVEHADKKTLSKLRHGTLGINPAYYQVKNTKPKKNRKQYLAHGACLRCDGQLKAVSETGCHVHTQYCCTQCAWGN